MQLSCVIAFSLSVTVMIAITAIIITIIFFITMTSILSGTIKHLPYSRCLQLRHASSTISHRHHASGVRSFVPVAKRMQR